MSRRRPRAPRRFTVLVSDRKTGVYRRFTVNARPVVCGVLGVLVLPVLIGLGLRWSAYADIARLQASADLLQIENQSYRAATGQLSTEIQSLQAAVSELGDRSRVDPATARAVDKLPAIVKSQAAGGPALPDRMFVPGLSTPEDTFGVIRDLLLSLETRLRVAEVGVARRQALASATPSIWPAHGWLTDGFGTRRDPFSGDREFHTGLDISTDRGQPVYATANGTIRSAGPAGAYGNMVVIDHGFGLATRYAHLDRCNVKSGDTVARGDVVGFVGATGRATGDHVHYEILVNGQMLNPLRFLTSGR
jgi:murein DD-endopeptidase MepM/ murein hydrolase activator NlpD